MIAAPMKTPTELQPLIDDGVIDEVLRSLKSGKEATVYLVRSRTETRCAKVYRNMAQRSFQKRAQYQEGRKVRGSRQARAMSKSTSFGRAEQEAAWKNAEVDALYQLLAAGVRVPGPTAISMASCSWNSSRMRTGIRRHASARWSFQPRLPVSTTVSDPAGRADAVRWAHPRRPV